MKIKTPNTNAYPKAHQHHEPDEKKQNENTEQHTQAYPSQLNTDTQKDKPNHQKNKKKN